MRIQRMTVLCCSALLAAAAIGIAQEAASPPPPAHVEAIVAPATSGAANMTILDLLQRGGATMYPLFLCSIVMVAFAIERLMTVRARRVLPPPVAARVRAAMTAPAGSYDAARLLADLEADESPLSRIVKAGLRRADRPATEIEKAIEDAGAKEVTRLQRNNRVLSMIAGAAPLLGLLGTVTGIMRAFRTVSVNAEALGRAEVLAGGIYEALVATAVGLIIAIPSMILFFFFQDRVERLVEEIDDMALVTVERLAARG